MKSKVLFLAMMLIGLTSATATTAGDAVLNGEDFKNARYRYAQPILFVERVVVFSARRVVLVLVISVFLRVTVLCILRSLLFLGDCA